MTVHLQEGRQAPAVAVFGAAGHTGRFLVRELLRRGLAPIAVGRNAEKLAACRFGEWGVEVREASFDDAGALDHAFAGAAAVVNCAGPFLDTAEAIASAALRGGSHYLDVSAEQPSAEAVFGAFDAEARRAGVVVMPAMGFYGGFADLLASAAMADWDSADEISIGIALDSWHPTEGTRITGARNTARRMVIAGGQLSPLAQPAIELDWDFAAPFARQKVIELPFSEVVVMARHIRTAELHTYLGQKALRDIRDPATPPPVAADADGRSAQKFLVEAVVRKGGRTRRIAGAGQDIYAFSAPLLCEAVQRILQGEVRSTGALAPGAAFQAKDFLGALSPKHLTLAMRED